MAEPGESKQSREGTGAPPDGFRWGPFFALHIIPFVVMPLLGYLDAKFETAIQAAIGLSLITLVQAAVAAERGRLCLAVPVFLVGAILQVMALAAGVIVSFLYHFTLW